MIRGTSMGFTRTQLLSSTVIASLLITVPSFAIAASGTATQDAQQSEENKDSDRNRAAQVEDIVVTGSRIRRNEFTSSQPIQVITAEQAALEGTVDTSELLQSSTAANTATQINNFFTGYVVTGGAGVNTISLRGLGANRTLVLINGRRAGPAGIGGTVGPADLNTIPSSQIERVEILTDGASSIYGSDAVAGVINIITKTSQDGGNAEVFYNQPFESGGEEMRANASYGWTFDRGYLTIGADYYERQALLFGDRDAFSCPQDMVYYDPALKIRADVVDPNTGDYKCVTGIQGAVRNYIYTAGDYRTIDYKPNDASRQGGGLLGCDLNGWMQTGGGYTALPVNGVVRNCAVNSQSTEVRRAFYEEHPLFTERYRSRTAISPVTRASVSLFGGYDLTSNVEVFGEFLFNRRESSQKSWRQLFPNVVYMANNFMSPDATYATPIALVDMDMDQQVDYTRGVLGIRGSLDVGRGWDWEISGQVSRSDATYGGNFFYADRVYATAGMTASGFLPSSAYAEFSNTGCVKAWLKTATDCPTGGVNWFSKDFLINGQLSPEEEAFIVGYEQGTTVYNHAFIEGVISGELFDLPAGPLGIAVGFQYRKEELDDQPGAQSQATNSWGLSSAGRTKGEDTIKEIFAELEIPVLRDVPLVDSLTFNLSGRYSDYDSYGENSTYKVGLNWAITPEWRIRSSYGTSFRAPALYELYLANQSSFLGQANIDPCINWGDSSNSDLRANCAAAGVRPDYNAGGSSSATIIGGGGKGVLEAETAEAQSIGLIWSPSFANLNVALDYYKVTISDQVARFGAANIVSGCYYSNNYANEGLCKLFDRNPGTGTNASMITQVRDSYINIAEQMSEGLDLNVRYTKEFAAGDLTLSARASYILDWTYQLRGDDDAVNYKDQIGYPDWTANLSARFNRADWTYFYSIDLVPEVDNDRFYTSNAITYLGQTVYVDRTAEFYISHNASIRKRMDDVTLQIGINNIFNENTPWTSSSGGGRGAGNIPLTSQYDYVGRRVFVSLGYNF